MKRFVCGFINTLIVLNVSAQSTPTIISTRTEKEVIPEGITVNPANGIVYVSSIALKRSLPLKATDRTKI